MFRFWSSVVEPLLTAARPTVIVEVGAQGGRNTQQLLDFARAHHSMVHVIEPAPDFDVADHQRRYGAHFVLHAARSLDVLGEIPRPDAVLIDGDHNWYTVSRELRLLAERCRRDGHAFPLTLLHDIGWPYGRRDLYYEPQTIPATHRQPYEQAGLLPGSSATVSEGGINAHLHNADHEGGPRNGVLTAIEDTLPELPGSIAFICVPGGHGLGILASEERMREAAPLRECVEWLQSADFLREHAEWLEAERLQGLLGIRKLELRLKDAQAHEAEQTRRGKELHGRLADVRREMRESEDRWEAERTELERQLEADQEGHNCELTTLQRELDSARRRQAWAAEEAAAANRQLVLLQEREDQLAQYAKQLEAQVADGERASQLTAQRARSAEGKLRDQVAGAQAQAILSEQVLRTVKREIDGARESRSWRFGHWVMQALRFLSFRPSRGTDALEKASARIAMVLSLGDSSRPIGETSDIFGRSKAELAHGDMPGSSNGAPTERVGPPNA